jgi:hypothetical protein
MVFGGLFESFNELGCKIIDNLDVCSLSSLLLDLFMMITHAVIILY